MSIEPKLKPKTFLSRKAKLATRQYYQRNKRRILAQRKLYYKKNKEKFAEYHKRHRLVPEVADRIRAYQRRWNKKNRTGTISFRDIIIYNDLIVLIGLLQFLGLTF